MSQHARVHVSLWQSDANRRVKNDHNFSSSSELYCRLDVLLLAECFLSFRKEVYDEFQLDCCHYISLPQLAFQCMLKSTSVTIECLSDPDMILFLESNIRGGMYVRVLIVGRTMRFLNTACF